MPDGWLGVRSNVLIAICVQKLNGSMMKRRNKSLCRLLYSRESNCITHAEVAALTRLGVILADRALVNRHTIHEVQQITPNERSAYVIESSTNGYAVTSHTSRCVSIIKTGTMEKICDIQRNNRTVWTIAIHPNDPSLVATGNMGGIASVFKDLQLCATDDNDNQRISSICFHPTLDLVCYGIQNLVIVWNWKENSRVAVLSTKDGLKIKYVKFIPNTAMLITGIRRETSEIFEYTLDSYTNDERLLNGSATFFLMSLFRTFAVVLDHMDFIDCDISLDQYWTGCLQQLRLFARRLVMVNGHVEPFKMVPLLGVHVNHIQDFAITLKVFSNKATAIAGRVPNHTVYNFTGDAVLYQNEIRALRAIVARFRKETVLIKNGYDIDIGLLEDTFCKIHRLMVLHQQDSHHFVNTRIYADFSRYHMKLQAWHFELTDLPDLKQDWRNVITCSLIHNDSSVDISRCGKIVASFREMSNGRFQINVHSLELHTFGQLLFTHDNYKLTLMMTVSISPSRQYLLVGLRSDRIFAYFLRIGSEYADCVTEEDSGELGALTHLVRYDKQSDDSISVLKWMARPGDGAIIGYRSFQLHCIRYK